jgi:hypothetical protein
MTAEHPSDLLHRIDLGSHHGSAPSLEEHACPVGGEVVPEELEVFFEQVGGDGLGVISEQVGQADLLFFGEVLGALEQHPSGPRQDRLITLAFKERASCARTSSMALLKWDMMWNRSSTSPGHGHLDRPEDLLPTGPEGFGDLLPAHALGAAGQEPPVGRCQRALALCPGNDLDTHATAVAVHPPHRVQEKDRNAPERSELETPGSQRVVPEAKVAAPRTPRPAVAPTAELYLATSMRNPPVSSSRPTAP